MKITTTTTGLLAASLLTLAGTTHASPSPAPTAAPAQPHPVKRDGSLPTGTALQSIFSTVIGSYTDQLSTLVASLTSAGQAEASSLRAGTKTRSTSTFVSGTAANCLLPYVKNNTAYCCPGGDIIDGVCYANGSGQFVDSTYFKTGAGATATPSSTAQNQGAANSLLDVSGAASMAAMGAAAAIGAAVLSL